MSQITGEEIQAQGVTDEYYLQDTSDTAKGLLPGTRPNATPSTLQLTYMDVRIVGNYCRNAIIVH